MKPAIILTFSLISSLLFTPNISMGIDIASGSISSALNPGPSTVAADLLYQSMNVGMKVVATYYETHNKCPAKNLFLKQPGAGSNIIAYVTNGSNCDVIGQFSPTAPGPLRGKTVRIIVKTSGVDSDIDFNFRQTVTDVDFGSNGVDPNFFQHAQPEFGPSLTLLFSNFGRTISTSATKALAMTYAEAEAYSENNSTDTSGTSSSSSAQSTTNISTR